MDNKRRVRIQGKPGETKGYMMTVHDIDTGEMIQEVHTVIVVLRANQENTAVINGTTQIDDFELDVTAYVEQEIEPKSQLAQVIEAVKEWEDSLRQEGNKS